MTAKTQTKMAKTYTRFPIFFFERGGGGMVEHGRGVVGGCLLGPQQDLVVRLKN